MNLKLFRVLEAVFSSFPFAVPCFGGSRRCAQWQRYVAVEEYSGNMSYLELRDFSRDQCMALNWIVPFHSFSRMGHYFWMNWIGRGQVD